MRTVADRSPAVPLNPVLVLPTYEPVGQFSLLTVIPLDEERVLNWLQWCSRWAAVELAEPTAQSMTFRDDTAFVVLPSAWQGGGDGYDLETAVIADSRALGIDESYTPRVYECGREIRGDSIEWAVELKDAPYRIATTWVAREQLLGFLCRVCSDDELPRRFADLMSVCAATALDLVEHGTTLIGEPAGSGRRIDQMINVNDLGPAFESADLEVRIRAQCLLSQVRRTGSSPRRN